MKVVNNFNCRGFGPLLEDKLCLIFKLAPSVCRMTFPILASLLVRLVVLLPFQLLRLSLATKHSVPRFFVPEHGTMFTLALVRFPPTATKEIQYLNAKGALTYTDIAGDPVLYGNLPPREISMKDVFRSGDSSKKFKIAEGQWY